MIEFENSGKRSAVHVRAKFLVLPQDFSRAPSLTIAESANEVPPHVPQTYFSSPTTFAAKEPPLFIVFAISYSDPQTPQETSQEWYFTWEGINDPANIVTAFGQASPTQRHHIVQWLAAPAAPVPSVHIQQQNPINSPNVIGDNNQVTLQQPLPRLKQRQLSANQQTLIANALKGIPPTTILIPTWDSRESQMFSREIEAILGDFGWKFEHLLTGERPQPYGDGAIRLGWQNEKGPQFEALFKGLTAAGVRFVAAEFETNATVSISLDVGVLPATDEELLLDRIR